MDTMDYTTAGVRRIKGIQHLSNWKLIILVLLLTSYTTCNTTPSTPGSSDQPIKEEQACTKENASFTWNYDVQPFYAIEWFFEETPIADTANASVSQDSIRIISKEYIGRFHLQRTRNVSFLLANVTEADAGYYSCIVHLRNTDIPKELKWKLHVKDCDTHDTSTKDGTTTISPSTPTPTPTPTPTEDTNILGIVLGICIPAGVIALVMCACLYRSRKGRCLSNHKEAGRGTNHPVSGNDVELKVMLDERV